MNFVKFLNYLKKKLEIFVVHIKKNRIPKFGKMFRFGHKK